MKIKRNIRSLSVGLFVVLVLSTSCRHHKHHRTDTTVYVDQQPNNTVIVNQQVYPPVVGISYPGTNMTSDGNYITVQGNVQNIQSWHQLSISQNGYSIRFFSYDPYNGNFHFQTFLQQGANNFVITANNMSGTGSQGVTVFYYQPNYNGGGGYPNNTNGVINNNTTIIPNGGGNQNNTNNNNFNPNANIAPNGGGNQNNTNNNNFNPNANIAPSGGGNNPTNNTTPNGGNNIPTGAPPVVQFVNPSMSPMDAVASIYNVSASVQNVSSASQIMVHFNGTNFTAFNFNLANHSLTFSAELNTGYNSVQVVATNSVGIDSKSTVIDYKPAGKAPRVEVFNPASSPFLSVQPNMTISGYVYNVNSSAEITVTDNGSPVSFNYNNNTHEIDVAVNLSGGNNQVNISASNSFGNDSKQVSLKLVSKNCGPLNTNPNLQPGGVIVPNVNTTTGNPHTNQNPNLNSNGTVYIDQTNTNGVPHTNQNPNLNSNGTVYIDQTNPNGVPHTNQNPNLNSNGTVYIDQTNPNGVPHTNQNPNLNSNGTIYIDQTNTTPTGGGGSNSNTGMAGIHHQPEITRTSPAASPYTTMSGVISVAANVGFMTNASGVSVTYNGSPVSFSFNPQMSEALNFTSPLRPGMNTFVIRATNSFGTASQNVDIDYVPTNIASNVNGNPNLHFQSGSNNNVNTPREFTVTNNQSRPQIQQQPVQQQKAPQIQQQPVQQQKAPQIKQQPNNGGRPNFKPR